MTDVDIIDYFVFLVGTLGTITIILNIFILGKLGKSSLRKFGLQVLMLVILFSIAGFLRSYQALLRHTSYESLGFVEYGVYTITYIVAFYKLYQMTETYGFNVD